MAKNRPTVRNRRWPGFPAHDPEAQTTQKDLSDDQCGFLGTAFGVFRDARRPGLGQPAGSERTVHVPATTEQPGV